MYSFVVYGVPAPQGSMKAFNVKGHQHPVVTADNPKTRPWKYLVYAEALKARGANPPLEGPVRVNLTFYMPRPKSAPKATVYPAVKPDRDKLERAIMDALTNAGIWKDDGQVIDGRTVKMYAGGRHPAGSNDAGYCLPRVWIEVERL
jgi:crossover junction endodeoxyribonuclease RusA